ncbi:hypothetical protein FEM33_04805 [Dyadobacter flavalbus]|uniref:Ig-like domain-containing protein n=1 Tax=Dyadobacter flavalbus TaxID=2579942 RepID=A0A5M8R292_9BACT|nr:hypothetical protein [Dyadobacter flavalbus]KAA6440853.1 hypothetical protein FEM33_04805 [Dyadobacter flavalbus]
MKKHFLYTLALLLFGIGVLKAQTIPSTNSKQCLSCVPPGWTGFSTPTGHLPSVSDKFIYGEIGPYITNVPNDFLATYDWVDPLPAPPSGHFTFLSINNTELVKTSASTTITGLIPGSIYKISAYVSTREIHYGHQFINGKITTKTSAHGKTAKLTLTNGASGSAEFDFSVNNYLGTIGKWHPITLKFTATASQATLTFSGTGQNPAWDKDSPQIVNLDLAAVPIERICSDKQIKLTSDTWNPCPGTTENLIDPSHYNEVPVGTPTNIPANFEVRVFDNPNHTGNPITTTTKNGTFYYFFYDKVNLCYNTNNSTAKLTVTFQGEQQVFINTPQIFNTCTGTTADLNSTVTPTQSNNTIVWFKSPQHLGTQILYPNEVDAGTYYAFYKNPEGCFLTHNSIAKVVVNIPPPTEVPIAKEIIQQLCPSETINLNKAVSNSIPADVQLLWFTNSYHQGTPVADPTAVTKSATYYAFYFDNLNQCYKTMHSTADVLVSIMPEVQVQLSTATIKNACPSTTVDLTKSISGTIPNDWKVVWYSNNVHSGAQVKNPASVSTNGSYYAFFYNTNTNCFQTVTSTSKVDVQMSRCDLAPTEITLNAKVFLQGAMQGDTMHNQLQTYFSDGTGLLPVSDPYDGSSTYDDIYNVQGVAGKVVDWVRVEIRNGLDPHFLLEAKNLLLKTNGKIVDVEGKEPIFSFQSVPVKVVVKHRNHIPIMSNVLNFTNKSVNYDFTTSLLQASNTGNDPVQMIQVNGVWCMWAGDVNDVFDMGIDATDYNTVFFSNTSAPFDVYIREDLNLDGGVDVTDLNMLFFNNGTSPYSTILNY